MEQFNSVLSYLFWNFRKKLGEKVENIFLDNRLSDRILNPGLPEDETGIQRFYHELWCVGNKTGSSLILS
jgi:hypothetical protein